jgi:type III pantothenate kinase
MRRALLIDAGNTTVAWRTWERRGRVGPTTRRARKEALGGIVAAAREAKAEAVALVASAPQTGDAIEEMAVSAGIRVLRPRRDFPVPMETEYYEPGQLGADRLCQAYAGREAMGAPVVTCSAGTCLTMEAVNRQGVLIGGAIGPGAPAMIRGIVAAAPHLDMPKDMGPFADEGGWVVGRSTEESLAIGVWQTLGAAVDRFIRLGRDAIGEEAPAVLTGGDGGAAARYCRCVARFAPDLALEGVALALQRWVDEGGGR